MNCYVGIKKCGCCVAAVVDVPGEEKQTAKDVAEFIRKGYRVEIHPNEWVRENFKSCKCAEGK